VRFGVFLANACFPTPESAGRAAQAAEAAGFDSIWTVDHVVIPAGYTSAYPYTSSGRIPGGAQVPMPDPLIWLAYIAALTSTIHLGTAILVLPQRNPVVVAKEVATLDILSGGRVELGVGAGWLKEEFDQLGTPFAGRGRRLEAYVAAMRALWAEDEATVASEFVTLTRAVCSPRPNRVVPIHVGGDSDAAARRAGRIGDGYFPGAHDLVGRLAVMRAAAEEADRDPSAIEVTAGTMTLGPDAFETVAKYAGFGVDRICIPPPTSDIDALPEALATLGESVVRPAATA
jgi:probable F420-dependent oxidoreductase